MPSKNVRKLRDWLIEGDQQKTNRAARKHGGLAMRFPIAFKKFNKLMDFKARVRQNRNPKI